MANLRIAFAVALILTGCGGAKQEPAQEQATTAPQPAPPKKSLDPRPVIAAFGDSLSAGFGADPGKSFPDYLQKLLDRNGYRYHVVNAGVSGDTTTDGVERMGEVLALKPYAVIVEFGGNDGLRGLPVESTRANLDRIVQGSQQVGAKVLLAGMTLPPNYGPEYIHSFERVYVDLAKKDHIARVPFLLDGVGGISKLMQQDGIHPTAEGNEKVAATVYRYLVPLLEK